jgi:hypothetical protein
MGWKVVATQQGQYNQVLRQPGEVFELLSYADGTYPVATRLMPKKVNGQPVVPEELVEEPILGKNKEPVHRHFAPDLGNRLIKHGPVKGDTLRFGWMRRVPDSVAVGMYPVGVDFNHDPRPLLDGEGRILQNVPPRNERQPENPKRNHAPILDVLPPEVSDDVAA